MARFLLEEGVRASDLGTSENQAGFPYDRCDDSIAGSVRSGDRLYICDRIACELTAVKREKFAKNKKNTSKERLSLLLFTV